MPRTLQGMIGFLFMSLITTFVGVWILSRTPLWPFIVRGNGTAR